MRAALSSVPDHVVQCCLDLMNNFVEDFNELVRKHNVRYEVFDHDELTNYQARWEFIDYLYSLHFGTGRDPYLAIWATSTGVVMAIPGLLILISYSTGYIVYTDAQL